MMLKKKKKKRKKKEEKKEKKGTKTAPRCSVPGGLSTTHLFHLQTPPSVSCHPFGLRPFGIQPCHRPDTRICAHLGPGPFCGRSSLSPPRLSQSRPPYFMAWPGG